MLLLGSCVVVSVCVCACCLLESPSRLGIIDMWVSLFLKVEQVLSSLF